MLFAVMNVCMHAFVRPALKRRAMEATDLSTKVARLLSRDTGRTIATDTIVQMHAHILHVQGAVSTVGAHLVSCVSGEGAVAC